MKWERHLCWRMVDPVTAAGFAVGCFARPKVVGWRLGGRCSMTAEMGPDLGSAAECWRQPQTDGARAMGPVFEPLRAVERSIG